MQNHTGNLLSGLNGWDDQCMQVE